MFCEENGLTRDRETSVTTMKENNLSGSGLNYGHCRDTGRRRWRALPQVVRLSQSTVKIVSTRASGMEDRVLDPGPSVSGPLGGPWGEQ